VVVIVDIVYELLFILLLPDLIAEPPVEVVYQFMVFVLPVKAVTVTLIVALLPTAYPSFAVPVGISITVALTPKLNVAPSPELIVIVPDGVPVTLLLTRTYNLDVLSEELVIVADLFTLE